MSKPSVEHWESSDNRFEKHYFLTDGQGASYQDGRYLFGINPSLVSPELEAQILELLRPIWDVQPASVGS